MGFCKIYYNIEPIQNMVIFLCHKEHHFRYPCFNQLSKINNLICPMCRKEYLRNELNISLITKKINQIYQLSNNSDKISFFLNKNLSLSSNQINLKFLNKIHSVNLILTELKKINTNLFKNWNFVDLMSL